MEDQHDGFAELQRLASSQTSVFYYPSVQEVAQRALAEIDQLVERHAITTRALAIEQQALEVQVHSATTAKQITVEEESMQDIIKILKILAQVNQLEEDVKEEILSSILSGKTEDTIYMQCDREWMDRVVKFKVTEDGLEVEDRLENND